MDVGHPKHVLQTWNCVCSEIAFECEYVYHVLFVVVNSQLQYLMNKQ